jgi:hypothetical protein
MSGDTLYGWLLRAYPRDFRATYGREMRLAFRQLRVTRRESAGRFWVGMIWDILGSAARLRADEVSHHWKADLYNGGKKMKVMAALAIVIGALEALNSGSEAMAGLRTGRPEIGMLILVVAALSAALLIAAGVALLARWRHAGAFARSAALTCLLVWGGIAALRPMFSGAASLVGIVFPAALLAFLYRDALRGRSSAA